MKLIISAFLTISLLLLSWKFPVTQLAWEFIDHTLFYALNPLTGKFPHIIKFVNSSLFDWLSDVVILVMMILYIRKQDDKPKTQKTAEFIYIAAVGAITIFFINKQLIPKMVEYQRISPSLELSSAIRLTSFFPSVKDSSQACFPGDHATTALFFSITYAYFTSCRRSIPVFFYSACMILPRVIIGAHWITDVIMGSFCISYGSFAIAFGTPLHAYCVRPLQKGVQGVLTYYGQFARLIQQGNRSR